MGSEQMPKVSVIAVDGSFRESHHSLSLLGNQTMDKEDFEFLWVEYYRGVNPAITEAARRHENLKVITLAREGTYHSSFCFNAGIRESRGELLVIMDADLFVENDFLERVWEEHQALDRMAMYLFRYNEPEKLSGQGSGLEHLRKVSLLTNPYNYGGCLTIRKKWLVAINGYEEHQVFESGFHANGLDVYTRLKNLGLCVKWHPEIRLYHPWHPFTLTEARAYEMQKVFIEYRAKSLLTSPFRGLDPSKDSIPPQGLLEAAERASRVSARKGLMHRIVKKLGG